MFIAWPRRRVCRWLAPDPYAGSYDLSTPQSFNRYAYVTSNPLAYTDVTGTCDVVVGGINQTPGTANTTIEQTFASSIGGIAVFPYANGNFPSGLANIISQATQGQNANTTTVINAIETAAEDPGPINVFTFSGGAQAFATALNALPGNVAGRIQNVTYISPGSITGLPSGTGMTTQVSGTGLLDETITGFSDLFNFDSFPYSVNTNCGHDANCELLVEWPFLTTLSGNPCTQKKGSGPGCGGGLGGMHALRSYPVDTGFGVGGGGLWDIEWTTVTFFY